jgi:hypothetical protein
MGYDASGPDITPALLDSFHNRQFAGDIVGDGLCSEKTAGTAGSSSQNGELILGFAAKPDGQSDAISQIETHLCCNVHISIWYSQVEGKEHLSAVEMPRSATFANILTASDCLRNTTRS